MSFRTRLLVIFAIAVGVPVGVVVWLVSNSTREAFERVEVQRIDALVAQFQREFARRGQEIARTVEGIAAAESVLGAAINLNRPEPDFSAYVNEAGTLAASHNLDLLEFVADDGTIISSAQWPARFGYKETDRAGWDAKKAFLKREELPDGVALAVVSVAPVVAGDRKLYVVGGQLLDRDFIGTLVLPAGMRALLFRASAPQSAGESRGDSLISAAGPVHDAAPLARLIRAVRTTRRESVATVNWTGDAASAETFHALPLFGAGDDLLGILLVGSSRRDLVELERTLRRTGFGVGAAGILLGLLLTWWASARVARPVKELAAGATEVAGGNWNAQVAVRSRDEIGRLAAAFNRMTGELRQQRDRLVQAERVAAWRELARRLAHELKNPLFPLQITVENMQRARERYPEQFDEVFREGTATLLAELGNLKQIIARFSDFAKMPPPELREMNLNEQVEAAMRLFSAQLEKSGITPRLELAPGLPPVQADPDQIGRVLHNLILNAIDAMPSGGTLMVRTAAGENGVRLEISDTGQGLTPEECARLFTPYYTTKKYGTGLGLAIVQSVVADHHGRVSVESQPGRGSTFRIDLPARAPSALSPAAVQPAAPAV